MKSAEVRRNEGRFVTGCSGGVRTGKGRAFELQSGEGNPSCLSFMIFKQ